MGAQAEGLTIHLRCEPRWDPVDDTVGSSPVRRNPPLDQRQYVGISQNPANLGLLEQQSEKAKQSIICKAVIEYIRPVRVGTVFCNGERGSGR